MTEKPTTLAVETPPTSERASERPTEVASSLNVDNERNAQAAVRASITATDAGGKLYDRDETRTILAARRASPQWHIHVLRDIEFVVRLRLDGNFVFAQGYRITSEDEELWFSHRSTGEPTADVDDAESVFDGWVKWDACSNLSLPGHYCGKTDVARLLAAVGCVYDLARAMLPDPLKDGDW